MSNNSKAKCEHRYIKPELNFHTREGKVYCADCRKFLPDIKVTYSDNQFKLILPVN